MKYVRILYLGFYKNFVPIVYTDWSVSGEKY